MSKPPTQTLQATGVEYYMVPEIEPSRCIGCALNDTPDCFAAEGTCGRAACDDQGVIYIRADDESLAEYIARRLE